MDQNYTHITVILDRSGSMESIKKDAEGGLNTFIEEQRKLPGKCTFTFVKFDDKYELVCDTVPLSEAPRIALEPRGWTALNDAIGKTINTMGLAFDKMSEDKKPGKVVVAVMTDGHENHSTEFSTEKIKEMITHQREKYNWQFTFLGADIDTAKVAVELGGLTGGALNYAKTSRGVQVGTEALNAAVGSYRTGQKSQVDYSDVENGAEVWK